LKNINKTAYPASGASSGVYLRYTVDPFSGAGIYVEGNAAVQLSTSGATAQVYTIKQGSTTTTVTIDNTLNTTTATSGGTTLNIAGVRQQLDPSTGAVTRDATMLFVDGNITSLSGPGEGLPAIRNNTALTITAADNVTVTQNQIPGTPADTLIPGNDMSQVLGIYTGSGDIQLKNGQSDGNLQIDASLATISNGGSGGLVNVGNQHPDHRRRANSEPDQRHRLQDAKRLFRPALRPERICAALVSVHHSNGQRIQLGDPDHHDPAHQVVQPHNLLTSFPT
jgi:hypothetical protein